MVTLYLGDRGCQGGVPTLGGKLLDGRDPQGKLLTRRGGRGRNIHNKPNRFFATSSLTTTGPDRFIPIKNLLGCGYVGNTDVVHISTAWACGPYG